MESFIQLQDPYYNCRKLSLWAALGEHTQGWHEDNRLVEPAANVMSSFYAQSEWEFKKKSTSIITVIHLLPISTRMSQIRLSGFWGKDLGPG